MNIIQEIKEKSQKLQTKWTVTLKHAEPDTWDHNYEEVAKVLQEEVDWEVMMDILKECGWTRIEMDWPYRMSESASHEIKEWCRSNLKGNYNGRGRLWLFELEKDASMFALRWS